MIGSLFGGRARLIDAIASRVNIGTWPTPERTLLWVIVIVVAVVVYWIYVSRARARAGM